MVKKYLVTGGTGFLGSKLVDKLGFYVNTDMKMLERDLKYEDRNNILKIFKTSSSTYEQVGDL